MSRHLMLGLAIAALAGCSAGGARPGDETEYIASDRPDATATVQAQQRCAQAGLAPRELRRFRTYDSGQGRMVERVYYTCDKPGR